MNRILFLFFVFELAFCATKVDFLLKNTLPSGLPLSYMIPPDYFANVPDELRPHDHNSSKYSAVCERDVDAKAWDEYEFQTETMLASLGLNIYDGSVWSIALSQQGHITTASNFYQNVLLAGKTFQFASIRANAQCNGVVYWGKCEEKEGQGNCGMCYGDNGVTVPHDNAFFFRMISDYWAIQDTSIALCPEKNLLWTWNDWRPVLGENAWANFLGALSTVYARVGKNVKAIPDESPEMLLATNLVPTLKLMVAGETGGVHYAPYNTYSEDHEAGEIISTENNASIYAGLKALLYIMKNNPSSRFVSLIPVIEEIMSGIEKYIKSSYSAEKGYFLPGGYYDSRDKSYTWNDGPGTFAVDCQTWVIAALGSDLIDSWYGKETALNVWKVTKKVGGYAMQPDGKVKGVGYSNNEEDQVFSGEWTYGAINWLRIMAKDSNYTDEQKKGLLEEADFMVKSIDEELSIEVTFSDGSTAPAIQYANKRYFIPFGWWANPVGATSSTAWSVFVENNFNPLLITGEYSAKY